MDNKIYDKNEFNWDDFREGKIAVWCETRELREDFLKQCDENNIEWGVYGDMPSNKIGIISEKGEEYTTYSFWSGSMGFCRYECSNNLNCSEEKCIFFRIERLINGR